MFTIVIYRMRIVGAGLVEYLEIVFASAEYSARQEDAERIICQMGSVGAAGVLM